MKMFLPRCQNEVSTQYLAVVEKLCFWPVRPRFDPRMVQKLEPTPTVLQNGDHDVIFTLQES